MLYCWLSIIFRMGQIHAELILPQFIQTLFPIFKASFLLANLLKTQFPITIVQDEYRF